MNIQTSLLSSFSGCYFLDKFLRYSGISKNIANVISCSVFQAFISLKCVYFMTTGIKDDYSVVNILQNLYGYFLYDLACLSLNNYIEYKNTFIFHHLISCIVISNVLNNDVKNNINVVYFVFLSESSGFFVNFRIMVKTFSNIKQYYRKFLSIYYFISRVVLLPISAYFFMEKFRSDSLTIFSLYISFVMLYIMSLNWSLKLI